MINCEGFQFVKESRWSGVEKGSFQGKAFRFPLRFACRARRGGARIRKINGCLSWGAGGAGRVIIPSSPTFVYPSTHPRNLECRNRTITSVKNIAMRKSGRRARSGIEPWACIAQVRFTAPVGGTIILTVRLMSKPQRSSKKQKLSRTPSTRHSPRRTAERVRFRKQARSYRTEAWHPG